jgi:hypothetical protein
MKLKMIRNKILIILLVVGFSLPNFVFLQAQPISLPETLEEAQKIGEKAIEVSKKETKGILERIWKEEALPILQKMSNWFKKTIWNHYIDPFLKKAKKEIEMRKPIIKEEFKKEKEEMKKEIKEELLKTDKSPWEKFKELIN